VGFCDRSRRSTPRRDSTSQAKLAGLAGRSLDLWVLSTFQLVDEIVKARGQLGDFMFKLAYPVLSLLISGHGRNRSYIADQPSSANAPPLFMPAI
jgi:hypothetical protein